ncbi:hypothetical protein [Bradyrhizobium ottawaense]|uniref:hypothetical protein n=1 Tax=Bradyrhizobium ottawaense TaxID=931866 RepID=UPI00384F57A8
MREQERIASRNRRRRMLANPLKRHEHNERGALWRAEHPHRVKLFKHEQRHMKAERTMRRYARKRCATPAWADQRKIETIYAIADYLTLTTRIEHQVDHFYPVMGATSCGLHVPENMRVITAKENQRKGNRTPSV